MALKRHVRDGLVGVALPALLCAAGCAAPASTTRALPVGLVSLGSLLDGCEPEAGDDGAVRMRCGDGVLLTVRARAASAGPPRYRADAEAVVKGAGDDVAWDQIVVPTEGPSGLVDRARGAGEVDGRGPTVLGVVRAVDERRVEEVSCVSHDAAGNERCRALVGGVLGTEEAAPTPPPTAPTTPRGSAGVVTFFGHALSLPTTCRVAAHDDGADATCGPATLTWRRFAAMVQATDTVRASLDALGVVDDGAPLACTIGGEPARCEAHEHALAGIAYLGGKPVAVLCAGVADPLHDSLCRTVIVPAPGAK